MYKNQSTGAFSQRQYKRVVRSASNDANGSNVENANMCSVKVLYDSTMGKVMSESLVNGSISVKKGDSVKLTATPDSGYKFVKWEGVRIVEKETSPTIDFVVNNDVVLTAIFAAENNGGTNNGGSVIGNAGSNGGGNSGGNHNKGSQPLISTIEKYWWVLALILGYFILKEDRA